MLADTSGDHAGSSPDASTSLSEGEWREPASLLALDTSFTTAPASPPATLAQQDRRHPQAVDHAHTQFPLTFSGGAASSGREQHPWREGGPAFEETGPIPPRPGGRAERRAERRASRMRDSTVSHHEMRTSMQSTGSLMTMMSNQDGTAETHTESDLSDGEVAASVVWWVGREDAMLRGSKGGSDVSDGEIRHPT